jgi:RNA polymerase sigma-70 factor (ECF subfamily)
VSFGEGAARSGADSDVIDAAPPETRMNTAAALTAPPASAELSWHEIYAHRDALVRFAQRRLLDPTLAEDVVHDVFEAVLSGRASFGGRAALRSWLTGILKHKIVDLVRQRAGWESLDRADGEDGDENVREIECPQPRPDEQAEQRERLRRTLSRIAALPPSLREVVQMRVIEDRETDDVCRSLAISEENLFVRLHRARKQLLC